MGHEPVCAGVNPGDEAPDELLERFIDQVPVGRALDLGMGDGDYGLWLAQRGFQVLAVDRDAARVAEVRRKAQVAGLSVEVRQADIRQLKIEPGAYSLIVAVMVLHFLTPSEIREVVARIKAGLQPGGWVMVSVFTTDDPGYAALQAQEDQFIDENTFWVPEMAGPLHYFRLAELRALFGDLEIHHAMQERHLDPLDEAGYRAGAFLVARRPVDEPAGES